MFYTCNTVTVKWTFSNNALRFFLLYTDVLMSSHFLHRLRANDKSLPILYIICLFQSYLCQSTRLQRWWRITIKMILLGQLPFFDWAVEQLISYLHVCFRVSMNKRRYLNVSTHKKTSPAVSFVWLSVNSHQEGVQLHQEKQHATFINHKHCKYFQCSIHSAPVQEHLPSVPRGKQPAGACWTVLCFFVRP